MSLLIKNGRVIDPKNNIDKVKDVLIVDGKIVDDNNITSDIERIIDAEGKWVVPGLIDLHVHLREPGFTHKETISTGTRSAALGGFTTICAMPNTNPVIDNEQIVEYIKFKAEKEGVVNVLPIGSITKGQNGESLSNIGLMAKAGICAISEDGESVKDIKLLKNAMKYSNMFKLPVFSHCEERSLSGKGQINAGKKSALLGLLGISNDSEEIIVSRDIILAASAKTKLHICHISTRGSVGIISDAKKRGQDVTAEVTPHHFTLCDDDIEGYDTNYKMNPPLRSREDLVKIKKALKDNIIDVIATDHAPHHLEEKNQNFEEAPNGIVGLETALPLGITELVLTKILTPSQLIEKMSVNPAKILGIESIGHLGCGANGDVTIIDPLKKYKIDSTKFASKSKNTPFNGREVVGLVDMTIVNGNIIAEGGIIKNDY